MRKSQTGRHWTPQDLRHAAAGQRIAVSWCQQADTESPLLHGDVYSGGSLQEWQWHFVRAAVQANQTVSFTALAGLTVGLIFEGELSMCLDGRPYVLTAETPRLFWFANTHPLSIKQHFKAGAAVHKFTLSVNGAWLRALHLQGFLAAQNMQLRSGPAPEHLAAEALKLVEKPRAEGTRETLAHIHTVIALLSAASQLVAEPSPDRPAPNTLEAKFIRRVQSLIADESTQLSDIVLGVLATDLGVSVSGLQRLAQKMFGQSLSKYIRQARLTRALRAMKETQCSVQEAAYLAGYRQASNFSLAFQKSFGFPPSELHKIDDRIPRVGSPEIPKAHL